MKIARSRDLHVAINAVRNGEKVSKFCLISVNRLQSVLFINHAYIYKGLAARDHTYYRHVSFPLSMLNLITGKGCQVIRVQTAL